MLTDLWASLKLPTISADDRRWVSQQLGFPPTVVLTQASAIRIAEAAAARFLVLGSYEISGPPGQERIAVWARLLNVEEGRWIGPEIQAGGPLLDLLTLEGTIAGEIALRCSPRLPVSQADLVRRASRIPLAAFSAYVKARMVEDISTRKRLLMVALTDYAKAKSDGPFVPPMFELGRLHFERKEYADAALWFRQIPPDESFSVEALFYLGLCEYMTGNRPAARSIYERLAELLPTADVYNNLAVIELDTHSMSQALAHYSTAVAMAPEDADIRFNYGYALWQAGDQENAVVQFRQVIRRRPTDGEAHFLLARSLQKLGRTDEAQDSLQQARHYLPRAPEWEKADTPPIPLRLKTTFDRAASFSLRRPGFPITLKSSADEGDRGGFSRRGGGFDCCRTGFSSLLSRSGPAA